MGLFSKSEARRAHPATGDNRPDPAALEELGLHGLVPETHRFDHELRHAFPLRPDRFFSPDPHRVLHDIA